MSFEALIDELEGDREAVANNGLVYTGKVGNASYDKLELVYVTEPHELLGNALNYAEDLYSEYAGDLPNLDYDIIMA